MRQRSSIIVCQALNRAWLELCSSAGAAMCAKAAERRRRPGPRRQFGGFTLLEIMIVVGIMGIILTMSVPIVWKVWHKPALNKAITDIVEVCSNARARAILQGHEVDLIIHPRAKHFDLSSPGTTTVARPGSPSDPFAAAAPAPMSMSGSGLSAQLDDSVYIEDLDINKIPGGFKDAELARVRFFPNGTSDEMSLFLLSDKGQRCEILLEVTTGLANVEWEVRRFR